MINESPLDKKSRGFTMRKSEKVYSVILALNEFKMIFENQEQIRLTLFDKKAENEKTGSKGKVCIPLGNLLIKLNFETFDHVTVTLLIFDSRVCRPISRRNQLNLERNQNSNREKINFYRKQISVFPEKKKQNVWKITLRQFYLGSENFTQNSRKEFKPRR